MIDVKLEKTNRKTIIRQEGRISALKDKLEYYKEITETNREPFVILDNELYVVTANHAFYRKFKVRKKDTEDKRFYELGNNQWDIPELRDLLEHVLPKRKILKNYEVVHEFPTLGRKVMLLNARQVESKQLILLAIEDVTAQQKLKADSDRLTARLTMQRDRLKRLNKSKDEFIALASHQLRTPATNVKQYVGMLIEGYAGEVSASHMDLLNIAYASNERQLEIIEDLLKVARLDAGRVYLEKTPYNIVQQVEAVIQGQAVLFEDRRQSVELTKPSPKVIVCVDEKLMHMVLDNLLDNAGKYTKTGGKVVVDIKQDDAWTAVSIQDNGVGIRRRDQGKLFKKFSRIDNPLMISAGGTGLGLYWARKILYLHRGSIEVISKFNKGSTFVIKMPLSPVLSRTLGTPAHPS